MSNPNLNDLFQSIQLDLEKTMEAFEQGGKTDMSELDKKVRDFCLAVTNLPPLEAKTYETKMHLIIQQLTGVVENLTRHKDAVGEEINTLNQRQRASHAYGEATMLNPEDED